MPQSRHGVERLLRHMTICQRRFNGALRCNLSYHSHRNINYTLDQLHQHARDTFFRSRNQTSNAPIVISHTVPSSKLPLPQHRATASTEIRSDDQVDHNICTFPESSLITNNDILPYDSHVIKHIFTNSALSSSCRDTVIAQNIDHGLMSNVETRSMSFVDTDHDDTALEDDAQQYQAHGAQ